MKKLNPDQMVILEGGKWYDCALALGGILGAATVASTFVGMGVAIVSIAGAIRSMKVCIDDIKSK